MLRMNDAPPCFIGFRTKVCRPRPRDWCVCPQTEHVVEIGSVSNCIVGGPMVWVEDQAAFDSPLYWSHAEPIDAWTAPDHPEDRLCLHAYRVFLREFVGSAAPRRLEPRQLFAGDYPLPLPDPDLAGYRRLGYDVVEFLPCRLLDLENYSRSAYSQLSPGYGHSPLSCNGLAGEYRVNQYCLLDDVEGACRVAQVFGEQQPEPGSYVVVEVLRHGDPDKG